MSNIDELIKEVLRAGSRSEQTLARELQKHRAALKVAKTALKRHCKCVGDFDAYAITLCQACRAQDEINRILSDSREETLSSAMKQLDGTKVPIDDDSSAKEGVDV